MGQTKERVRFKGVVIFKHETEENWEKSSYIPEDGETVIYDPDKIHDYPRIKVGNGIDMVKNLPFSGGSDGFIDVTELPTENINESATYRTLNGVFLYNKMLRNDFKCIVADWEGENYPVPAEPVVKEGEGIEEFNIIITSYYNIKDNTVYGYFDSNSKSTITNYINHLVEKGVITLDQGNNFKALLLWVDTGWKKLEYILTLIGSTMAISWGGIVSSIEDEMSDGVLYLCLTSKLFNRQNKKWIGLNPGIGYHGFGIGAEVFNNPNNQATGEASHAEGMMTGALGRGAHAEGEETYAEGPHSHSEGYSTVAAEQNAHAEGCLTEASGPHSHAEGYNTIAKGSSAHAEGVNTKAEKDFSHAEGHTTTASGEYSHAEGFSTSASGAFSHAEGSATSASGDHSHAEGYNTSASGKYSHAGGYGTNAKGTYQTAIGRYNQIDNSNQYAFIVGNGVPSAPHNALTVDWAGNLTIAGMLQFENGTVLADKNYLDAHLLKEGMYVRVGKTDNTAAGEYSTAGGINNVITGTGSHAVGGYTQALGPWSHTEGWATEAHGNSAHAEGNTSKAIGDYTHVEGWLNNASGKGSHIEGCANTSFQEATWSHIEGYENKASGNSSHIEGYSNITSGFASHAEGSFVQSLADSSHAEGFGTIASGKYSHAGGYHTEALVDCQTVVGRCNAQETEALFIVGCGSADTTGENKVVQNCFSTGYNGTEAYIKVGQTILTESQLKNLLSKL